MVVRMSQTIQKELHVIPSHSWVFRFVTSCRHKNEHVKVTKGPLSVEELMSAEEFWIKKA